MRIDEILRLLRDVRPEGDAQWTALCPAHDDHSPSLSIAVDGERILMHCHAGCHLEDVLAALGIEKSDLFARENEAGGERRITATYRYQDEGGSLLFEVVRYDPKGFSVRHPGDEGHWINSMDGVRPVPYRLPGVLAADPSLPVFVVEGEKDADMLTDLGLIATTNPGGAGKWRSSFSEYLRGRAVVVIADDDDPGHRHAATVARSLQGVAESVKVLTLPSPGKDVSEWLAFGGSADELLGLVAATADFNLGTDGRKALGLVPLSEVTREEIDWIWPMFLPRKKLALLVGDPDIGKTFVALDTAARLSRGLAWPDGSPGHEPGKTLYITYEDGLEDTIRPRAEFAGADLTMIVCPKDRPRSDGLDVLAAMLELERPTLVVIDPIQAFVPGGLDVNRVNQVRRVLEPLGDLARDSDCCVLAVAHLTKGARSNALYRVLGSVDFVAAPRSVLLAAHQDGTSASPRILVRMKGNFLPRSAKSTGLVFDIREGRVHWMGTDDASADAILGEGGETGARAEARKVIESHLVDGPCAQSDIQRACEEAGISGSTLKRAKKELGVRSVRSGQGPWYWALPVGEENTTDTREPLDPLDTLGGSSQWNATTQGSGLAESLSSMSPQSGHESIGPVDKIDLDGTGSKEVKSANGSLDRLPDPDAPSTWPTCEGCERLVPRVNAAGVCPDCEAVCATEDLSTPPTPESPGNPEREQGSSKTSQAVDRARREKGSCSSDRRFSAQNSLAYQGRGRVHPLQEDERCFR